MSKAVSEKPRAARNRTLTVGPSESTELRKFIVNADGNSELGKVRNRVICSDAFRILPILETQSIDLLFCDPPYNLNKEFGKEKVRENRERRIRRVARFVAEALRAAAENECEHLHLRRLAFERSDPASRVKILPDAEPHHMGT
jgi:hypothetical protein